MLCLGVEVVRPSLPLRLIPMSLVPVAAKHQWVLRHELMIFRDKIGIAAKSLRYEHLPQKRVEREGLLPKGQRWSLTGKMLQWYQCGSLKMLLYKIFGFLPNEQPFQTGRPVEAKSNEDGQDATCNT